MRTSAKGTRLDLTPATHQTRKKKGKKGEGPSRVSSKEDGHPAELPSDGETSMYSRDRKEKGGGEPAEAPGPRKRRRRADFSLEERRPTESLREKRGASPARASTEPRPRKTRACVQP